MRRTTITALLAAAVLALAGCSSGGEPEKETVTVTASPTATPSASPSLSQAEAVRLCTDAITEAAPGWSDWNFDPGAWQDDPRTPAACLGLVDEDDPSAGNRAFMGALLDGLGAADDPRARS
jgi:ABC-type glycerol-3-phosphate transport system substrate-binding protein